MSHARGTVQLIVYVPSSMRELARLQASARGQTISKWIGRAIRDLAAAERADPELLLGRLLGPLDGEKKR